MAVWHRIGRCVLRALFTDTVTIYNKISDAEWKRTVVEGVQWSGKNDKANMNGRISIAHYVSVTFPQGTYENLTLDPDNEEDCIVLGEISDVVGKDGSSIEDLLVKYPDSGLIKAVNDNSKRTFLPNIKVVLD